jgi:ligand-binding sensor domain-containing protein/signal transduction histidine kinase
MSGLNGKRIVHRTEWALALLFVLSSVVNAEQLPIKTYTTADGLARDAINCIVRDSRGFLWFGTPEGISRFDGYKFTNYTTDDGLPHRSVRHVLETRSGIIWIATGNGVCRLNPTGSRPQNPETSTLNSQSAIRNSSEPMFVIYYPGESESARSVNVLIEDHTGAIWCGTGDGIYRLEQAGDQVKFQFVDLGMPSETGDDRLIESILEDRRGALWVGTRGSGLYRRWPDGAVEHYTTRHGLAGNRVSALLEDRDGRLWVATIGGLCLLVSNPTANLAVVDRVYTTKNGLANNWINVLFQSADGKVWVGSDGLTEFIPTAKESDQKFRTYTTAHGLSDRAIQALAEDRDGDLWIGTESGGAMKLVRNGFTTFSEVDGLGYNRVSAIYQNQVGELCVDDSRHFINRFDGNRFTAIRPNFPGSITYFGWGWYQWVLQDHAGEWWVPTGQGLCRFPRVNGVEDLAHTRLKALYTTRDGLITDDVFRLFEDTRGDIWIGTISTSIPSGLSRWERVTETFHRYLGTDELPASIWATAFCEDASGNLWIGTGGTGLARYRAGRFTVFTTADELPANWIAGLYRDHSGRLWIATSDGVGRIDDPSADHPRFVTYTATNGLSSNQTWCITEDQWGHIYIGTGRGVDRLNPETGQINHYTAADGLARGYPVAAFRDSQGALWFGTLQGLSRFLPEPDRSPSPPPVFISGLRVAGALYPVSELGETNVSKLTLGPGENQIQIDFVGLSFATGESLQYQYKLEGADRDWSALSDQRTVNYASLSSGSYRFVVRAINALGIMSESPATVTFTVLPPIWRRWWFLALAALLIGVAAYAGYRYRVARLIELERVRTRIATDLHDDIGANLSLIAMASEVVRMQSRKDDSQTRESLSLISDTSRELVDAMGDIVWAVNPSKDHLSDLTKKMRRFASDVFSARNIAFRFHAPGDEQDIKLGADTRREVFLIFKESVNNIARHSQCSEAAIQFQARGGWLALTLSDDGKGFNMAEASEGSGLESMRKRAARLGGKLDIVSNDAKGTMVTLQVPLGRRTRN